MWINQAGLIYVGDLLQGDREATAQEVTTWEAARTRAAIDSIKLTPRQFVEALIDLNLIDEVEAAVALGDRKLRNWWEKAQSFERNHPLIVGMGQALDKTPAELDAVFQLGATL